MPGGTGRLESENKYADRRVRLLLALLVVFDLVLTLWAFLLPDLWFAVFHGSPRVDPQALLQRCGANWAAFCTIQVLALLRWRRERWWLSVVAGCRLGDCLTDITCLAFCDRITAFGAVAFPAAGIGNVLVGVWLLRAYLRRAARA